MLVLSHLNSGISRESSLGARREVEGGVESIWRNGDLGEGLVHEVLVGVFSIEYFLDVWVGRLGPEGSDWVFHFEELVRRSEIEVLIYVVDLVVVWFSCVEGFEFE